MALRAVLCVSIAMAACGWAPADEQTLARFFEYSSLHDLTRATRVASVVFDPRVEGVVDRFRVVSRVDQPQSNDLLRREVHLQATVRTAGGRSDRTLIVTMERQSSGAWMVRAYRWAT